jgi:hypothetical protein
MRYEILSADDHMRRPEGTLLTNWTKSRGLVSYNNGCWPTDGWVGDPLSSPGSLSASRIIGLARYHAAHAPAWIVGIARSSRNPCSCSWP